MRHTAVLWFTGWLWFSLVHFGGEAAKNKFLGEICRRKGKNLSLGVRSHNLDSWKKLSEVWEYSLPSHGLNGWGSFPVLHFYSLQKGTEVWEVGRKRISCCKEKYRRTKLIISSRLGMCGKMRSEMEWSCGQTNLKELQGDLCDLSKLEFTFISVPKPSKNILTWRKPSASEVWPAGALSTGKAWTCYSGSRGGQKMIRGLEHLCCEDRLRE